MSDIPCLSDSFFILWTIQEDIQADTESDEEEQPIYNPLKLPLGWDGKPIPYWLYKLHGLGQVQEHLIISRALRDLFSVASALK